MIFLDWDEEAPEFIEDVEATMPEDWMEEEMEFIDDPTAAQPEEWDEEEDGEYIVPQGFDYVQFSLSSYNL